MMHHIVNNLWLGSQHDADELVRNNPEKITAILNVRGADAYDPPGRDQAAEHPGKAYKWIPAPDIGTISPKHVREALLWLREQTDKREQILIHCQHGISRSPAFLAAFMVESGISPSLEEAKATISVHRPVQPATQIVEHVKPVLLISALTGLHHLKASMVDFIRRPPESGPARNFRAEPLRSNAEPSIEDVELPAEDPQLAAKMVSPAAAILREPGFDPEESARLIFLPEPLPSLPVEPPSHFATEASTIARPTTAPSTMVRPWTIRLRWKPLLSGRSVPWYWRVALSFAAVVLVAMVLGFGIRQNGNASAQGSGTEPVEKIAAPATDVDLLIAAGPEKDPEKYRGGDPGQASALAVSPSAMKSEANSSQPPKESLPAKAGATTARAATSTAGAESSRRYDDNLIARDTVTYLDKHAAENAAARAKLAEDSARRHPSSHERK